MISPDYHLSQSQKRCLIIGGGPAGSSAALSLAREGWKVTLVDRRSRIEQKICGECLSPPSRAHLKEFGVWSKIPPDQIQELDGITLIGPRGSHCFLDFGLERPFTIPRPTLDQALLDRAREEGTQIELGVSIGKIERQGQGFLATARDGRVFGADFLIGADGRHSWVARQLQLAQGRGHSLQHAGVMGHFTRPNAGISGVEMHVGDWGYVGLNPLPGGLVNGIAVLHPRLLRERLSGRGSSGLLDFLSEHLFGKYAPASLRERMEGSVPASSQTWTVSPIAWAPDKIVGPRCALLGDSAGFVDPFTGEGLYHAIASARELATQIRQLGLDQGLKHYEHWHLETFGPEERFCHMLQKLLPFSRMADYAIRQLGEKPKLRHLLTETVADRLPTEKVLSPWFWCKVLWPIGLSRNRNAKGTSL